MSIHPPPKRPADDQLRPGHDRQAIAPETEIFHTVNDPYVQQGDPMVAYVDGRLDVSSQYNASGSYPDLTAGAATHHHFFNTDLLFLEIKIQTDTPHIVGSSMVCLDGVYHSVSANAFFGDVVVMRYDADWSYLGVKTLAENCHSSEGVALDGQRFYVAYLDTSQRTPPNGLAVRRQPHRRRRVRAHLGRGDRTARLHR